MRVLFLTSHGVDGRISDDGFEIGLFSPATVFLLVFASVVGTVGGLAFGLLRVWLRGPRLLVAIGLAIAASAVAGGGFLVHGRGHRLQAARAVVAVPSGSSCSFPRRGA